jgi:large subunit ribosomal protein L28
MCLTRWVFTFFSEFGIYVETIEITPHGALFLRKDAMSRTCEICGKHTVTGNKVSHAKNHTRRTWKPNLVKVKTEIEGTTFTVKICARCLKSDFITKKVNAQRAEQ